MTPQIESQESGGAPVDAIAESVGAVASSATPQGDAPSPGHAPAHDPLAPLGDWQPVDPAWVVVRRLREWIDSLVLTAVVAGNAFAIARLLELSDRTWLLGCGVLAVALGFHSHLWPAYAYRFHGLRLRQEDVEIRSGALFRTVTAIPRARVQHVDVVQGPVERRYGIARLVIHTAGARSAVELAGVAESLASRIRDRLMQKREDDAG